MGIVRPIVAIGTSCVPLYTLDDHAPVASLRRTSTHRVLTLSISTYSRNVGIYRYNSNLPFWSYNAGEGDSTSTTRVG